MMGTAEGDEEAGAVSTDDFDIVCEIEPPTSADMAIVREQIAVLGRSCSAFLVPDSHLGRATVSSVAVAHEVAYLHGRAIACLNARDRNLLGLQRDLLTAAAYGVRELLFVYGDAPQRGERSTLTVKQMLAEVRSSDVGGRFRIGVAADVTRDLPDWKREADFVLTQITLDVDAVARWRERAAYEGPVYAGVMVFANEKMALRLSDLVPGLHVPDATLRSLAAHPDAGVELAIAQVLRLRETGAVNGVHLIPARRFRETAVALDRAAHGRR